MAIWIFLSVYFVLCSMPLFFSLINHHRRKKDQNNAIKLLENWERDREEYDRQIDYILNMNEIKRPDD